MPPRSGTARTARLGIDDRAQRTRDPSRSRVVPAVERGSVERQSRMSGPSFAHASEAEFARILDYYGIGWEYEPRTFPILWNLDGKVVESFAPDFYLPELDIYVELTTLRQSLVRKKNRKLRRLRELYPSIRIKLFYARDFRALMLKYGRIGLADSLSGAEGQATPPRGGSSVVAAASQPPPPPAPEPTGREPAVGAVPPGRRARRRRAADVEAAT